MDGPIYPLIVDKFVIYIGGFDGDPSHYLIIMDLKKGKLVEKYVSKDDEEGFSNGKDPYYNNFHIQYYKDGYIYLERRNSFSTIDDKGLKQPYIPSKLHRIYLLKVNF